MGQTTIDACWTASNLGHKLNKSVLEYHQKCGICFPPQVIYIFYFANLFLKPQEHPAFNHSSMFLISPLNSQCLIKLAGHGIASNSTYIEPYNYKSTIIIC